jgi:hypothetical protein
LIIAVVQHTFMLIGRPPNRSYTQSLLLSLLCLAVGALLAQNRWLAGMKRRVARKEVWFWAHIAVQVAGAALVIAAFAIAVR